MNEIKQLNEIKQPEQFQLAYVPNLLQNQTFPLAAERAEKILVILIPEHNEMSGGIYSFFSIAKSVYDIRHKHDYFILIMTRPNKFGVTYTRQRNFRNSEDVFRFEQIVRCRAANNIYILIPEYATTDFVKNLNEQQINYLLSRENIYINILNQKTDLMPQKENFSDLRSIATELTQSVAHHAYFGQKYADYYDLPTLLLPAYTDLSQYMALDFLEKEKLIIYSPDDAPYREAVLQELTEKLPDYTIREIRGITFDQFMGLAARCRFSVTFGEGFDGYLAQPIHMGGVGFAVYNEDFFPSSDLLNYTNIFSSGKNMVSKIVKRIRSLENDPDLYRQTNRTMLKLYDSLYSKEDYMRRIEMLVKREFEIYPLHLSGKSMAIRL